MKIIIQINNTITKKKCIDTDNFQKLRLYYDKKKQEKRFVIKLN